MDFSFERVIAVNCLATPDLGAGVEQPFDCLIFQNSQAEQSMSRSMDWTFEDNMVNGLFFCATLTGCRGGHTPSVQVGVETTGTGVRQLRRTHAVPERDI